MSPAAHSVIRRLDGARQQWWFFTLLSTCVLATCISFGTLLLFMLSDALLRFSQLMLSGLFVVWVGVTLALIVMVVRRLIGSHRTLEATARRVEAEFPELGSNLINIVQLSSDQKNADRAFCEAAVSHAVTQVGHVQFEEAAAKESRLRRFLYCIQTPRDFAESLVLLGVLIVVAVLCYAFIPSWGSAADRLMKPWQFVPAIGSTGEIKVTPGDTEVLVGSSVDIAAEINNAEKKPYNATLFVTVEGEKENPLPMTPDGDKQYRKYKLSVPSVVKPLRYRVEIGDSESRIFSVGLCEKPVINEVAVTYRFPQYLGRPAETFKQKVPDLEAPQYTEAELRIRPSVRIAGGHVQTEGQRFSGRVEDDGNLLVVRVPMLKNTTFTVHLTNDAGHTDPAPRVNRVTVLPDRPPAAELLKPARQESIAPGGTVAVKIRANDDHAVGRLRLEMKLKKPEPAAAEGDEPKPVIASSEQPAVSVQEWTTFAGTTTVLQDYVLSLPADKFPAGASVLVRAVAWDKRDIGDWGLDLKPQQGASGWHTIQIVAEEARSAAQLEQLDNLRTAIFRIMEKQIRARGKTAVLLQKTQLPEAAVLAGEIRTDQVEIQKLTNTLSASIKDTDQEDRRTIKRILNNLAFGDMLDAVGQCDEMVKLQALEGFPPAGGRLGTTQEKIVEVLRKLLDVTRQAQAETLAEMKKRAVGDLPNDTKQKLEEIRAKLEKFMAEQKKVIEASENLAKTPVEDFAEKEEQLLKTLAAQQDEWSKIMKDLHSDLSKLPEQDFANSSMAKELNEIQTELKMAEDALLKKSADIAVPLEQLGYERAEEITTNMEKWLPDRPDREKWSQEESPSDADKEAPMAELPGELEDLVGELMEEEEDLFDEMEDVSSSAADSIDKGAGWDVADGPISNMSAKGATGNRLPNTSEIGGRSGEGRSGKSSGEFVGDEAVGKDGRKTPARLTPDPYVKGQIKDHSKDPQGGASGGGKESGEGGEGLEGPAPGPKGPRDLHRLAGKQAALRNKAEGIDAQMQVMNYHHTDMEKLLGEMEEIERDLQAGRYQNALRKREIVLQSLASQKQYMEGEFQVKQDTTANLPTDVQKDILGGMQDPSPPGWEELVRGYYEQLATSGGAPPAAAAPAPAAPGQPAPAPAPQGQPAPAPQPPPPGN